MNLSNFLTENSTILGLVPWVYVVGKNLQYTLRYALTYAFGFTNPSYFLTQSHLHFIGSQVIIAFGMKGWNPTRLAFIALFSEGVGIVLKGFCWSYVCDILWWRPMSLSLRTCYIVGPLSNLGLVVVLKLLSSCLRCYPLSLVTTQWSFLIFSRFYHHGWPRQNNRLLCWAQACRFYLDWCVV